MGARAALRAADDPQVRGVVALAPWCPPLARRWPNSQAAQSWPSTTRPTRSPLPQTPGTTSTAPGQRELGSAASACLVGTTP
nr:hypothetical protein [Streptomyces sp. 2132.2]